MEARIQQMMDGMSKEDSTSLMELISPTEFLGFGVDSAEVIKGRSAWRDLMKTDFVLLDKFAFSRPRILSVSLSDNADLASSLLEVPVEMGMQGKSSHALARFAQTWRKENGKWLMINFLLTFPTTGQSAAELVEKMKDKKM